MTRKNLPSTLKSPSTRGENETNPEVFHVVHTLQPGYYWRAKKTINEDNIPAGTVLLLQKLEYVDNVAHTVQLWAHPSNQTRYAKSTYSMLVKEFVRLFEPEPDAEQIRARELAEVQNEITQLQADLTRGQVDPVFLLTQVKDNLLQLEQKANVPSKKERLPTGTTLVTSEPVNLTSLATALSAATTPAGLAEAKAHIQHQARLAEVKATWLAEKTGAIAQKLSAMAPFFEEKAVVAIARTQDARDLLERISKGLETLDLYLGKGVDVQTLATGEPAAFDEPLTVMQQKLFMDEEMTVWAPVGLTFDASNRKTFFKFLVATPALMDQIFPTTRCIVAVAASRQEKYYEDAQFGAMMNQANKNLFLLVRNGENIHVVVSPVTSHLDANQLFPTLSDLDEVFTGFDGKTLTIEDLGYARKMNEFEQLKLHYKRFLVLIAGLDHRDKLFGNFYPEKEAFNFVTLPFQQTYFRLIADGDASKLLGTGHKPLDEYLREARARLQSGSRVFCLMNELLTAEAAPGYCRRHGNKQPGPNRVLIAYKDAINICVDLPVVIEPYSFIPNALPEKFETKITLTKYTSVTRYGDRGLGYLVLDAINPDDLAAYINSRLARADFTQYIEVFKHALVYLRAERVIEAPARAELLKAATDAKLAAAAELAHLIDETVLTWRAARRGLPLCGVNSSEWKSVLDQLYAITKKDSIVTRIKAAVEATGRTVIRVVSSGRPKYLVYASPLPADLSPKVGSYGWVVRIAVDLGKRGVNLKDPTLVQIRKIHPKTESVLWQAENHLDWVSTWQCPHRYTELVAWASYCDDFKSNWESIFDCNAETWEGLNTTYQNAVNLQSKKMVASPRIFVPFGVFWNPATRKEPRLLGIAMDGFEFLWSVAPTEKARTLLEKWLRGNYQKPTVPGNRIQEAKDKGMQVQISYCHPKHGDSVFPLEGPWVYGTETNLVADRLKNEFKREFQYETETTPKGEPLPLWYFSTEFSLNTFDGPEAFKKGVLAHFSKRPKLS